MKILDPFKNIRKIPWKNAVANQIAFKHDPGQQHKHYIAAELLNDAESPEALIAACQFSESKTKRKVLYAVCSVIESKQLDKLKYISQTQHLETFVAAASKMLDEQVVFSLSFVKETLSLLSSKDLKAHKKDEVSIFIAKFLTRVYEDIDSLKSKKTVDLDTICNTLSAYSNHVQSDLFANDEVTLSILPHLKSIPADNKIAPKILQSMRGLDDAHISENFFIELEKKLLPSTTFTTDDLRCLESISASKLSTQLWRKILTQTDFEQSSRVENCFSGVRNLDLEKFPVSFLVSTRTAIAENITKFDMQDFARLLDALYDIQHSKCFDQRKLSIVQDLTRSLFDYFEENYLASIEKLDPLGSIKMRQVYSFYDRAVPPALETMYLNAIDNKDLLNFGREISEQQEENICKLIGADHHNWYINGFEFDIVFLDVTGQVPEKICCLNGPHHLRYGQKKRDEKVKRCISDQFPKCRIFDSFTPLYAFNDDQTIADDLKKLFQI